MGDGDIRQLPYPPIWVNQYIKEELLKYDFNNIITLPSTPSAIDDVYKNTTGSYPDLAIQYDRLFRLRRTPFYPMKCEQLLYYVYSTQAEKIYDAMIIISQLLDRSDAAAEDLNRWAAAKQSGSSPILDTAVPIPYNVYFHDIKVYQLEEARDLGELGAIRGLTLNKLIIEYDYHVKEPVGAPEDRYR
jgi:hypothetical protein